MSSASESEGLDQLRQIDSVSDDFEFAFHGGENPRIEDFLGRIDPPQRPRLLSELLRIELEWIQRRGETITPQQYLQRFPQHVEVVRGALESCDALPDLQTTSTAPVDDTQPSAAATTIPSCPGRFGRFVLQQQLGAGGFGTVFLAEDTQLGRQVALKIPKVSEGNKRFLAEARAAAKLQHANIVTVHDSGIMDGHLYIVCAFVEGADLATVVKTRQTSLRQLIAWIRDAARALAYSHSQGVIHRDIKPGNLLISNAGQIYVADFGLARRVEESSSLTADGTVLGTPAYMAPEQAAGRTAEIGTHSDQYSLGAVLYEILTGRRPFLGNVREVLQKVIHTAPPPVRSLNPKVPAELEAICLKSMAKQPDARYPSLEAFANDLDRWLQLRAQQSPQRPARSLQWRQVVNSKGFKIGRAVTVFGAVAYVLWSMFGGSTTPTPQAGQGAVERQLAGGGASLDDPKEAVLTVDPAQEAATRAAAQLERLLELVKTGQSWALPAADAAASADGAVLTVVEADTDLSSVTALVTDAADASRRDLWTGKLEQSNPRNAPVAAWTLPLHPQERRHELPSPECRQITLAALEGGNLNWIDVQPVPVALKPVPKPAEILPVDALAEQIFAVSTPGRVWEGTLQESGEASRKVRLTFTESRDDGQHVRAILESVDAPYVMAPFLGTIDQSPNTLLAGRPIRLARQAQFMGYAGSWQIFSSMNSDLGLQLATTSASELTGVAGSAQLRLKATTPIQSPLPRTQQWRSAIEPGAVWSGVMKYQDEPPSRVRFTIAEVRDDHSYVRILAQEEENPQRFSVYEGAVNLNDAAIDGYAFSITMRVSPPNWQDRYYGLFSGRSRDEVKHSLRLTADGATLICRTRESEWITLTREPESAPLPLDRTTFTATWMDTIVLGRAWEGVVLNTEFDQRSAIHLTIASAPDALGKLNVLVSVADKPQVRMGFTGTLLPDTDVDANAFALKLTKVAKGQGNSVLFGNRQDVVLHLRLGAEGKQLIGMAATEDRGWTEFLVLDPLVAVP